MIAKTPRVIPVLLLKNQGLVKTRQFRNPVYVGNPTNAVKVFNEKFVQEIVILNIGVSKDHQEPDYRTLKSISNEAFFPLAYGGGITSAEVARKILRIGFEKIVLNHAVLTNPALIQEISLQSGSQSVVVCVNVTKTITGAYRIFNHVTGGIVKQDLLEYVKNLERMGAGEIIIQAVYRDGMMSGYDTGLIHLVSSAVTIPVIALGGAKSIPDFVSAVNAGASAVAAGSMFVFQGPHRAVLISYPSKDELKREFYQNI